MNKIFTLIVVFATTITAMAQNHGNMNFIGNSSFSASTAVQDNEKDTVIVGDGNTSVTLPVMYYKAMGMTLPSIKFTNLQYVMTGSFMTGDMFFTWQKEYADTLITLADGVTEKHLKNVSLLVTYEHSTGELKVDATLSYGSMPFPVHYTMTGYYTINNTWNLVGRGTEGNPYKIYNIADLQAMATNISATNNGTASSKSGSTPEYFLLMNDIDFENTAFAPIGSSEVAFAGSFDGDNHAIKNLASAKAAPTYTDLFYALDEETGAVKNLSINGTAVTAISSVKAEDKTEVKAAYKVVSNGKLTIVKNGKEYNAAGAQTK